MNNINWQQFELCNADKNTAFENLCRLLFNRMFFDNKAIFHSNPNNPGIEIEPVYCQNQGKYISFQAKYFDKLDYFKIKHSCEKAVKYYNSNLDAIYLFCNKDINKESQTYKNIVLLLKDNGIELIVISNQEILNKVSNYSMLVSRYFGGITLTRNWFEEKLIDSIESLGQRHNCFNIETKTEEYFNLFIQNENALKYINNRKYDLIERISNFHNAEYNDFLNRLENEIKKLPKITSSNIYDCVKYSDKIYDILKKEFDEIKESITLKEDELKRENIRENKNKIFSEIRKLREILDLPLELSFSTYEKNLIEKRCLIIKGDVGTGKTQLLSNSANEILRDGDYVILLLGQNFISNESIKKQILSILDINIKFDEFLNCLEVLGEENNRFVYIFIDALNESTNKNIWRTNLNSLINALDKFPHIKLVLSVRSGFEAFVIDDAVNFKIKNQSIPVLVHKGFFEDSIEAIQSFLNYYNIPFSPSYAISYEMTNPLFLKLYCDTYDGEDVEMFSLFEKVIRKTNNELNNMYDLGTYDNIIINLLNQIVDYQLSTNKKLSKEDLLMLPFWDTYGLNTIKLKYLESLSKSNLLNTFGKDGVEYYYFGYNLLDDFLTAKRIIEKYNDEKELINYIKDDLLGVKENLISKYENLGSFTVLCSLYYEKYQEELFSLIIDQIKDDYRKQSIIENYIESFQWRKKSSINEKVFIDFVYKYKINRQIVFDVLFQNAAKVNNPLNAEFLHKLLVDKSLAHRDCLWTTYINTNLAEESRVYQLIELFEKGNACISFNKESIMLILTIFSWLLTSSNRFLRDETSKAIIEILKKDFDLCVELLKKFENVNDPYVIQRLYGIVFGACTRSQSIEKSNYLELVKYVYYSIFDKELIYPDILLRDYAKSIIEFYIYKFGTNDLNFDTSKINPPYKSIEIPIVDKQNYYTENNYGSGFNMVDSSMKPSSLDYGYGDFGRYEFESALNEFKDVDVENAYHYAMQFIRDELGYTDELFSEYDINIYSQRHETKKIERIGKKYQWIAMYNILARISDHHLLNDYDDGCRKYRGTWEPYVRDFDPTINYNSLNSNDIPKFELDHFDKENLFTESENPSDIKEWASTKIDFFVNNKDDLVLKDTSGIEWVLLHQHSKLYNKKYEDNHRYSLFSNGNQQLWKMSMGYFVDENLFNCFKENFSDSNFNGRWFPEIRETYQMFCREFAWSDSFKDVFDNGKRDIYIDSDEFEIKKTIKPIIKENSENILLDFEENEYKTKKQNLIGQVIQSYLIYLWECQYDASQKDSISLYMPCKEIIDCFKLTQKQYDGCFYDGNQLIVYDGSRSGIDDGLLIRKDYLECFLKTKHLKLFWTCLGEKQYFRGHLNNIWSEWSGFLYMDDNGTINGLMNCKEVRESSN